MRVSDSAKRYFDHHFRALAEQLTRMENAMSDLSAQVDADTSGLDADLDAINAKLDAADANQLTPAQVDKLNAVKAKADALAGAAPVVPAPAPAPATGDVTPPATA